MIHRITPEYFHIVKRSTNRVRRWTRGKKSHYEYIAALHGISYKTVIQVANSDSFEAYTQQNKAQHPETEYSLKEDVLQLYTLTYGHEKDFVKPKTAKQAIGRLIYDKKVKK